MSMFSWFRKKEKPLLPFTTDVHSHLIPGIDDGSDSVEKSVRLLQHMQQWGLTRLVATPHVTEDTFENTPATIDPSFGSLVAGAREAGVGIEFLQPSAEYRLDNFFLQCLEKGIVRPFPGNYLLVENSFNLELLNLDEVLFDLSVKGYKPVLAHPERYVYYHNNLDRYRAIHRSGVLFQCNLMSLGGYYGKEIKKVAEWMLENDMIDFLGTDLHGMRHVVFIERYMSTSHFARVSEVLKPRLLNDRI